MSLPVYVNGDIVAAEEAVISPLDQGFSLGLAVFETLLYEDGCVYFVDEHMERLRSSAQMVGVAWPPPYAPREALRALADVLGDTDVALRITISRGVPGGPPTTVVVTRELERYAPEGIALALSTRAKLGAAGVERVKSTNRLRNILAQEEARAAGAREALLPTEEGDFSEGTYTNLFAVRAGRVSTPSLDRGCLPGIMRGKVLGILARSPWADADGRACAVAEERVERVDLEEADEVFLTSTLGRVIPVRRILGVERDYPGSSGPVVRELKRQVTELEARHRAASATGFDPTGGPPAA